MKLKSNALHFEINNHGSKPSAYIRNSFREDGKVKHETISSINGCTYEQLTAMKAAFDGQTLKLSDIVLSGGREYGLSKLLFDLAGQIGLSSAIYSRNEPWVKSALAMIIGRIVYQGSKLSLSKVSDFSCLWDICGISEKIDVNKHCYAAMDELLSRQKLVQKKLAKKHLSNNSIILYDITSSYFEGEYLDTELVTYGYNRDKKQGKKQIVIGLICTENGCPIAVEVFNGNTNDSKTVNDKIDEVRKDFEVNNMIFVGDRGMLTQQNLDENSDTLTVTALTHAAMKKLCEEENVQLSLFDETTPTEVVLPEEPHVRYALRKNPVRLESERNSRRDLIAVITAELDKIATPKRKTTTEKLGARVGKIFNKYGNEKYFNWDVKDNKIVYSVNEGKVAEDEKYDGLYVIRCTVPPEQMTIHEVVQTYGKLINIEQAFRQIKTVQLELRPTFHHREDRIKSHVFICMLSYYLLWHFREKIGVNLNEHYTVDHLLEILKAQQELTLIIGKIETTKVAEPTEIQAAIISAVLKEEM